MSKIKKRDKKRLSGILGKIDFRKFGKTCTIFFLTVYSSVCLGGGASFLTGNMAFAAGSPIEPVGLGELIPMPNFGGGGSTLFESISAWSYYFSTDLGSFSWLKTAFDISPLLDFISNMLMMLLAVVVFSAIGLTFWAFSLADLTIFSDSLVEIIGTTGGQLMGWLAPTALALGALITFIHHKRQNGALNQFVWFILAGTMGVGLVTSPALIVQGVDNVRSVGAELTFSTVTLPQTTSPIPYPGQPAGSSRDVFLRQSADTIWRSLVVTPWCVGQLGSVEACKVYGLGFLESSDRTKYMRDVIYAGEGGKNAPTSKWVQGGVESGLTRVVIALLALVVALAFCLLLVFTGFGVLVSIITIAFLLAVGAVFALMWCIPGKPRAWGNAWLDHLIGAVFMATIATFIFGVQLSLLAATFAGMQEYGWMPTVAVALALCIVAFTFRRTLLTILQMVRPSSGVAPLMGYMAMKQAGKMFGKNSLPQTGKPYRTHTPTRQTTYAQTMQSPTTARSAKQPLTALPAGSSQERLALSGNSRKDIPQLENKQIPKSQTREEAKLAATQGKATDITPKNRFAASTPIAQQITTENGTTVGHGVRQARPDESRQAVGMRVENFGREKIYQVPSITPSEILEPKNKSKNSPRAYVLPSSAPLNVTMKTKASSASRPVKPISGKSNYETQKSQSNRYPTSTSSKQRTSRSKKSSIPRNIPAPQSAQPAKRQPKQQPQQPKPAQTRREYQARNRKQQRDKN